MAGAKDLSGQAKVMVPVQAMAAENKKPSQRAADMAQSPWLHYTMASAGKFEGQFVSWHWHYNVTAQQKRGNYGDDSEIHPKNQAIQGQALLKHCLGRLRPSAPALCQRKAVGQQRQWWDI